jgi:hypothetical protein
MPIVTAEPSRQFDDELLGLDPDDPEARAFAAHLDRMQEQRPAFTVEGYLAGVGRFAESANRASGPRRLGAVAIAVLLLVVAAWLIWEALVFVAATYL